MDNDLKKIGSSAALRGEDILCFSHDWTGDPLSKTHIMRVLSKDNRILWINAIANRMPTASSKDVKRIFSKLKRFTEPVKEVEKNIFVLNPLAIPTYGRASVRSFNERFLLRQVRNAMNDLGFASPVNMVFNPAAGLLAGKLGEKKLIYYCVDEYTAFTGAAEGLREIEEDLFRDSDLVVVSAEKLLEDKKQFNENTHLIRHGTDWRHFRTALDPEVFVPTEIADLPKPIIGFHGLLADWVDFEGIRFVAEHFGSGSVVLVGKTAVDAERKIRVLDGLPNVVKTGRRPYEDLPSYCKAFDVGLNPFIINDLTLAANPLKVREYLAAGLPVVSSDLPEVRILEHCYTYESHDELIEQIKKALKHRSSREEISDSIRNESWESKVDELRELIEKN
ncbi:MAG: glycosyltransferase [Pyrinomonadaceae bacterium]|nr:glycosyltransferase [Pyrinomonadaceae bacterium]